VIKMMFGWRDNPGKSAAECEHHYRTVHMEMAKKAFDGADGFVAVVYNRVRAGAVNDFNRPERREVEPDLDAILELYFRDEQSMREAFARPQMAAMFDDHPNFMATDTAANVRIYEVEESVFFGSRAG
jgi:uncharacterized protein (TIGR02118 family)